MPHETRNDHHLMHLLEADQTEEIKLKPVNPVPPVPQDDIEEQYEQDYNGG